MKNDIRYTFYINNLLFYNKNSLNLIYYIYNDIGPNDKY